MAPVFLRDLAGGGRVWVNENIDQTAKFFDSRAFSRRRLAGTGLAVGVRPKPIPWGCGQQWFKPADKPRAIKE